MTEDNDNKLIFERISAVMNDLGAVDKTQVNQQQRFNFRGIDDVYNACHKIMAKHQVFTTVCVNPIERKEITSRSGTTGVWVHNRYCFTFYTVDGSYVTTFADGEAMDYGDKASNKAAAIAHKYALIQTFCIPTKIDDPDSQTHEIQTQEQYEEAQRQNRISKAEDIYQKFKIWGATEEEVIKFIGYDAREGLTENDMSRLKKWHNELMRKNQKENSNQ